MYSREEKAVIYHKSGLNCAQSIVAAYSEELNYDLNLATSLSCGFGSGMGRLQEKCGAVTGAFMVLSMYASNKYTDNAEKKNESYLLIQQFNEKFNSIHGSTDCMSLLKVEIKTKEGFQHAKDNNLFELICNKLIADSVKIIDELILFHN